jgi:hypothetical protein
MSGVFQEPWRQAQQANSLAFLQQGPHAFRPVLPASGLPQKSLPLPVPELPVRHASPPLEPLASQLPQERQAFPLSMAE